MAAGDGLLSSLQQAAIAYDYTANMARAVEVLEQSWVELRNAGIIANGGDPGGIENWYLALWDYNSGFHVQQGGSGPWGLGWTNNPANADYPPTRRPFLRQGYDDAAHPGNWPYQEKVLGWAEHAQLGTDGTPKYTPSGQLFLSTNYFLFCVPAGNQCDPSYLNGNLSYCTRADRECWWHDPVTWNTEPATTENSNNYVAGQSEPASSDPQRLGRDVRPHLRERPRDRGAAVPDRLPPARHRLRRALLVRPHDRAGPARDGGHRDVEAAGRRDRLAADLRARPGDRRRHLPGRLHHPPRQRDGPPPGGQPALEPELLGRPRQLPAVRRRVGEPVERHLRRLGGQGGGRHRLGRRRVRAVVQADGQLRGARRLLLGRGGPPALLPQRRQRQEHPQAHERLSPLARRLRLDARPGPVRPPSGWSRVPLHRVQRGRHQGPARLRRAQRARRWLRPGLLGGSPAPPGLAGREHHLRHRGHLRQRRGLRRHPQGLRPHRAELPRPGLPP